MVQYFQALARNRLQTPTLVTPGGVRIISQNKDSPLEAVISKLPDKMIRDIAAGDKEIIQFIRMNTHAMPLKEGEGQDRFMDIDYGVIPAEVMKTSKIEGDIKNYKWYHSAFKNETLQRDSMGRVLNFSVRYDDSGIVIPGEELKILLKHRTRNSGNFRFAGDYSSDVLGYVVEFLYSGLSTPEKIDLLPDHSQELLNIAAHGPLKRFYEILIETAVAARRPQKILGN